MKKTYLIIVAIGLVLAGMSVFINGCGKSTSATTSTTHTVYGTTS
jgi:hypothetical protein